MTDPVLDTFSEHGHNSFLQPAAMFADFHAAGILRRCGIQDTQHIDPRDAILDVALHHGYAILISSFVLAKEERSQTNDVLFLLKEPVAIQKWVSKHVQTMEEITRSLISTIFHETPNHGNNDWQARHNNTNLGQIDANLQTVTGLTSVVHALIKRLHMGKKLLVNKAQEISEVQKLVKEGLAHLWLLLHKLHSLRLQLSFLQWMSTYDVSWKKSLIQSMYKRHHETVFLIDRILECAQLPSWDTLLNQETPFLTLIASDAIHAPFDIAMTHAIESYFVVPSYILLYLALDMSLVSKNDNSLWDSDKIETLSKAFVHALPIPDSMRQTILGLWILQHHLESQASLGVEKLVSAGVSKLDTPIVLSIVNLLVSQNYVQDAWKVWTNASIPLDNDIESVTCVVTLCLSLRRWEMAWSILREHSQYLNVVLMQVLQWHERDGSFGEIVVKQMHLKDKESQLFELFCTQNMASPNEDSVQRMDALVMFYALRSQFELAKHWHNLHKQTLQQVSRENFMEKEKAEMILQSQRFVYRDTLVQKFPIRAQAKNKTYQVETKTTTTTAPKQGKKTEVLVPTYAPGIYARRSGLHIGTKSPQKSYFVSQNMYKDTKDTPTTGTIPRALTTTLQKDKLTPVRRNPIRNVRKKY